MAALDLGDIGTFPFLDPPDPRQIGDGLTLLAELGALRAGSTAEQVRAHPGRPDDVGAADRPAVRPDDRRGRTSWAASTRCWSITAALAIQDVREQPLEDREKATASHARFNDPRSDFLSLLKLWNYLAGAGPNRCPAMPSAGCAGPSTCTTCGSGNGRTWSASCGRSPAPPGSPSSRRTRSSGRAIDGTRIHQALLAGLLAHIGSWDEARREYQGTRGARFSIWPGSVLAKRQPKLVMAAELVETSRLWARTVAAIEPGWAEPVGCAPAQARLLRAALGGPARVGGGDREGDAARRDAGRRPHGQFRRRSIRSCPGSCSSGTRWSRATGGPGTVLRAQPAAAGADRRARGPGPPPGHRRRRRDPVRAVRRPGADAGVVGPALRLLVQAGVAGRAGAADLHRGRPASPRAPPTSTPTRSRTGSPAPGSTSTCGTSSTRLAPTTASRSPSR